LVVDSCAQATESSPIAVGTAKVVQRMSQLRFRKRRFMFVVSNAAGTPGVVSATMDDDQVGLSSIGRERHGRLQLPALATSRGPVLPNNTVCVRPTEEAALRPKNCRMFLGFDTARRRRLRITCTEGTILRKCKSTLHCPFCV
jgi:hypothetical protein